MFNALLVLVSILFALAIVVLSNEPYQTIVFDIGSGILLSVICGLSLWDIHSAHRLLYTLTIPIISITMYFNEKMNMLRVGVFGLSYVLTSILIIFFH